MPWGDSGMLLTLLRIALRSVVRHRRRSSITFLAALLAVAVMLSIRGFFNGMQASIIETTVRGQTGALQIHRKGLLRSANASSLRLDIPTDDTFLSQIRSVPGVTAAAGRIFFSGIVSTSDLSGAALLAAIDPMRERDVCPLTAEMVSEGKTLGESVPHSVILTAELAKRLGLKLGQSAAILSNDSDGVLNALEFRYSGVYGQPGFALRDKMFGFVPLADAQQLLRMEGRGTEIVVAVRNLDDTDKIKPVLQAVVGPAYEVSSWREVASFLEDVVARQNFVLNLCSGIFLLISLLGIGNTMLMSVQERTREIGTMMSLGVRRNQIRYLFLMEAMLLGLSGGLLGSVLGGGLVSYLGYKGILLRIPGMLVPVYIYPRLSVGYICFVIMISATGATLAALWPAVRASSLRPIQALSAV